MREQQHQVIGGVLIGAGMVGIVDGAAFHLPSYARPNVANSGCWTPWVREPCVIRFEVSH